MLICVVFEQEYEVRAQVAYFDDLQLRVYGFFYFRCLYAVELQCRAAEQSACVFLDYIFFPLRYFRAYFAHPPFYSYLAAFGKLTEHNYIIKIREKQQCPRNIFNFLAVNHSPFFIFHLNGYLEFYSIPKPRIESGLLAERGR